MILKIVFCSFIAITSVGSIHQSGDIHNKRITVVGTAINDKDAAAIETGNGYYLIDGLDEWDEKYYGKKVKATGRLIVKTYKQRSTYPGEFQERVGTVRIIKNPKWELVN